LAQSPNDARRRSTSRIALSLAVVAIPFAALTILALRQLQSIEDVFTSREQRAVRQYARLAAREFSYLIPQEEGTLLQVLDLSSMAALTHSISEADETFPAISIFALDEEGLFIHPEEEDAVWQLPPLDLVLERKEELLACLSHDHNRPTRLAVHDEAWHLGISLYPWRAEGNTGVIGFCWDPEQLSVWTETVALVALPRNYTLELTDGFRDIVARYPDTDPFPTPPDSRRSIAAEYPLGAGTFRWWARVEPSDPAAVTAVANRQVRLYTTAFVFLSVLMAAGLWVLASVTLREGELARRKADFAANISHELRTPLTLIRASAEAMSNRPDLGRERVERYLGIIERETRRLGDLISNVLQYARRSAESSRDKQKPHDAGALVRAFADDYRELVAAQGFRFTVSVPDSETPVRVDADALQVVLVNLLDNAVKFSGERKSIALRVTADGGQTAISVADEGIGIADEDQSHVFEEFFRAERDLVKKTRGTGIGLALVHRIVAAHGGRVAVTSAVDEGTTFTVHLPLNKELKDD
jgi:signal transduction histidine kinase